jgi:hypothetical protein
MRMYIYNVLRMILNIRNIKINYSRESKCCTSYDKNQKQNLFITILMGPECNCPFISK